MLCTVNPEYFVVKIFSDSLAYVKVKCAKIYAQSNNNAVQGCLSENHSKYFRHEIFATYGMLKITAPHLYSFISRVLL